MSPETPKFKLSYYNIPMGRVEPCRIALVIGGIPFEDERFPDIDAKIKERAPYRQVPLLEIDGKIYAQSVAILRYIGKLTGLYPKDPLRALQVDEVVDAVHDFLEAAFRTFGQSEEVVRPDREKLVKEDLPRFVGGLEKRLVKFGDGPYAVGGGLSVADLWIANCVNMIKSGFIEFVPGGCFDEYERFLMSWRVVMGLPKVVEWYGKHPIEGVTDV